MCLANPSHLARLRSSETDPDASRSHEESWELVDWLESLEDVIARRGPDHAAALLRDLQVHAQREGVNLSIGSRTPYVNSIPHDDEPAYPGDLDLERRIDSLVRWNAMAMVVRANKENPGIGGHLSTFTSICTLYEVGLNHFFRGPDHPGGGDLVYFQGHASPGNYAREYLEGRFEEKHLDNFRRDLASEGGPSSYPHPWLMPEFWQFPTVSMGLEPIAAIYQARFLRYLEDRGLVSPQADFPHHQRRKVWCFVGDGETDEPKGYGFGEAGEGLNVTHQQKKLDEEALLAFHKRFEVPLPAEEAIHAPYFRPPEDSPERLHLKQSRRRLGGNLPQRRKPESDIASPGNEQFEEFLEDTDQPASTTMVIVRILANLLKDEEIGARIVPIVADEARTFGMEALFRQVGIYAPAGQLYEPVDSESLLYYRETPKGQLLEEGITEAGSMGSFIAAGTSASNHGLAMIPFFTFYSMFGFQRVGDLIWAAGDSRARGFLIGATSGRTTLNGEGLQHEDGQSHVNALAVPNLFAYDTAFAFEVSEIIKDGLRPMTDGDEDVLFYLTVGNESYPQPPMPEGAGEGILRGMYCFRDSGSDSDRRRVQLLGSGALLNEAIAAAELLEEKFDVAADIRGVTSYQQLSRDAAAAEREHRLNPESELRQSWLAKCLENAPGPLVAVSDYLKALPDLLGRHLGRRLHSLGTDGFGRSDTRSELRGFFEVDRRTIALAALYELMRDGQIDAAEVTRARDELEIDPEHPDPLAT